MKSNKCFFMLFAGLLAFFLGNKPAFCITYYVPDDYPTIQAAVDATWGGETIIVRAGTYTGEGNRNIKINKIITVKSETGPENTVIDCEGAGRGFTITNVSNLNVLDGFKIINGSVTGSDYGGGIYCSSASPQVSNCIISDNSSGYGGGIYSSGGSPIFNNCIINNNHGGGIYSSGDSLIFNNCVINNNSTPNQGGGIYFSGGSLSLNNCVINDNSASAAAGGGIYFTGSGSLSLSNCTIIGNSASYGGGISAVNLSCINCVILMNNAGNGGGGIYISGVNTLTNCTFAWNSAGKGGGIYGVSGTTTIRNSIFYFDSALQEIYKHSGTMTITYSNIMGGYTGEGNIDKHPEFATGGDFHLSALSPCIDTASPVNAPDIDIDDELRPHGDGYDMGADEFDGIPAPLPGKADLNEDGVVDGLDVSILATEFGKIY